MRIRPKTVLTGRFSTTLVLPAVIEWNWLMNWFFPSMTPISRIIGWAQCRRVSPNDSSKVIVTRSMPFTVISNKIATSSHHVHLFLALVLQILQVFAGNATSIGLDLFSNNTFAGTSGYIAAFFLVIRLGLGSERKGREGAVLECNFWNELGIKGTRLLDTSRYMYFKKVMGPYPGLRPLRGRCIHQALQGTSSHDT